MWVIYVEGEVWMAAYKIFSAIPIISWLLQSDSLCRRQCELAQIRPGLLFCAAAAEFELLIHCCWVFLLHSTNIGGFVRVLAIDRDGALSILITDILFLISQLCDRSDKLMIVVV